MLSRDHILAQMRERVHHPAGTREHELHRQYEMLERWVLQKVAA